MSDRTSIEWTDATWNPVTGCSKVSEGCDHCYAESIAKRFAGTKAFPQGFAVQLRPERLTWPLERSRPRRIFVNSVSDLFHKEVPDEFIAKVFAVMAACPQHIFQVLTKRPGRMRSLLSSTRFQETLFPEFTGQVFDYSFTQLGNGWEATFPLPNVWLGTSVETQKWADVRIPLLLDTPAAVRWISAEPLLGPVDLRGAVLRPYEREQGGYWEYGPQCDVFGNGKVWRPAPAAQLDWVVAGGESGPRARPMHPQWARHLRDQCEAAQVPFLFKQRGEWTWTAALGAPDGTGRDTWADREPDAYVHQHTGAVFTEADALADGGPSMGVYRVGKKRAGRDLDRRTWDQYPDDPALAPRADIGGRP